MRPAVVSALVGVAFLVSAASAAAYSPRYGPRSFSPRYGPRFLPRY
jgi:hypothetical protein